MLFKTLVAALLVAGAVAGPTRTVVKREPNSRNIGFFIPPGADEVGAVEKRDSSTWPPPPICSPHPCHVEEEVEDVEKREPNSRSVSFFIPPGAGNVDAVEKREPNSRNVGFFIPPGVNDVGDVVKREPSSGNIGFFIPPGADNGEAVEKREPNSQKVGFFIPPGADDVEHVEKRDIATESLPPVCDGHPCPPDKAKTVETKTIKPEEAIEKRATESLPPFCDRHYCPPAAKEGKTVEEAEEAEKAAEKEETVDKRDSATWPPPPICSPHPCH